MGYYVKSRDSQGLWRWTFKAANHEPIAVSSESYWNEADCDHGIGLVKNSGSAPVHRQ